MSSITTHHNCVVIGAGHAAAQLVASLRQQGWEQQIMVIGDEFFLPYHRPPLSKDFLSGSRHIDDLMIRPPAFYERSRIHFTLGVRADSIDRVNRRLLLDNGEAIGYGKLVLATGSRVRRLPVAGAELPGVFYVRTISDVEKIRAYTGTGKKVVIIGGGYIGLECAAVLRRSGMDVTVLEALDRLLERVTSPEVAGFYQRVHTEEGVAIVTGARVTRIEGAADVERVECAGGLSFAADLVIIGIGVIPETELAEGAGLAVDNGIVVNEFAQTSDPDILAIGDCTRHRNPIYDRLLRLESVQNARDQATVAAATICDNPSPYNALPWFWSDQYDIKLQIAGLCEGYEQLVLRGDLHTGRSYAAFYLRDGKLLAVDAINRPQEFMIGKRLIMAGTRVEPSRLGDENIPVKELLS